MKILLMTILSATLAISTVQGEEIRQIERRGNTRFRQSLLTFSPDGRVLAGVQFEPEPLPPQLRLGSHRYFSRIILWDTATAEQIHVGPKIEGAIQALKFLPDGRTLASTRALRGSREVVFWSLAEGQREATFRKPQLVREVAIADSPLTTPNQIVTHLALSPDGRSLAGAGVYGFTGNQSVIRVWPETGTSRSFHNREASGWHITDLSFSSDSRLLLTLTSQNGADWGFVITGRDADDPNQIKFQHKVALSPGDPRPRGLAAVPMTSMIVFPGASGVTLFDTSTLKVIDEINIGTSNTVHQIAVSPDGRLMAISTAKHGFEVTLIELKSKKIVASRKVKWLGSLDFSPDSKWLAVSDDDPFLWNVADDASPRASRVDK